MTDASSLWMEAHAAVGPSRDDMWEWLEARYFGMEKALLEIEQLALRDGSGVISIARRALEEFGHGEA